MRIFIVVISRPVSNSPNPVPFTYTRKSENRTYLWSGFMSVWNQVLWYNHGHDYTLLQWQSTGTTFSYFELA